MALRHPFPVCGPLDLQRVKEPDRVVPKLRKGREVEFRRSADLNKVCTEIVGYQRVKVNAAAGAGKSTLLPIALAEQARCPVIHVVPSILLSSHIYDYCSKQFPGKKTFCEDLSDSVGTVGVTYTSSANVVALLLAKSLESAFSEFADGVYLYLDECHESDGWTCVLRRLASQIPGVKCVVEASASHGLDHRKMAELPSESVSERFPNESPAAWDPADLDRPWSSSNLNDHAILYIDENDSAERLINMYGLAGITAYRLHAKMSVESFRRIYAQLSSPDTGVVVMIADYSFRSGFTFPVSVIVDSGIVKYYSIDGGHQVVKYRYAYALEMYQTQHRGARIEGLSCTYYSPEKDPINAICDLEGVETELAALLFRYLGFIPPEECRNAFMCKGLVPLRFEDVVNGSVTFPLLGEAQMGPLVKEISLEVNSGVQDVLAEYGLDSPGSPVRDFFSTIGTNKTALPPAIPDAMSGLLELYSMTNDKDVLVPGRYYKIAGLPNEKVESTLYGDDWKMAFNEIRLKPHMVVGFTETQRLEVIALLLENYNVQVAVQSGVDRMMATPESLKVITTRYPNHVKKWLDGVMAKFREARAMQSAIVEVLMIIRPPGMEFIPLMPDVDMETRVAKGFADNLVSAVQGIDEAIQGEGYLKYVESRIDGMPLLDTGAYDKLIVDNDNRTHTVKIKCDPVKVQGKSMWDITYQIDGGLMWNIESCVDVVNAHLQSAGFSIVAIRRIRLVGPKVDGAEVLSRLRNVDDLRHRHKLRQKYTIDTGGSSSELKLLEGVSTAKPGRAVKMRVAR